MYDVYCFDLYGTLIDIRTDENDLGVWRKMRDWYLAHGVEWSAEGMRLVYRSSFVKEMIRSKAAVPEADVSRIFFLMFSSGGVTPSEELIAETAWLFRRETTRRLRLYAGAKELLGALRQAGKKLILCSDAQRLYTMPELEQFGLIECFDRIYLSSDLGCKKQDPAFFARVVIENELMPNRCLMVGNDPYSDAEPARNAGMDAYCVRSAISPKDAPWALYDRDSMDLKAVRRDLWNWEPEHEVDFGYKPRKFGRRVR